MARMSADDKQSRKLQKKADKAQEKATAAAAAAADASDRVPGVASSKRNGDNLLAGPSKMPRIAALAGPRTDPFSTVPAPIRQAASSSSTAGTPASSSSTVAAQASSSSTSAAPASSSSTAAAPLVVDATGGVTPSMQALLKVYVKESLNTILERVSTLEDQVSLLQEKVVSLERAVILDGPFSSIEMDEPLITAGFVDPIVQDGTQMTAAEKCVPLDLLRYLNNQSPTAFKCHMYSLVSCVGIVPSEEDQFHGLYNEYKDSAKLGNLRGVHMARASLIFKEGEGTADGVHTGKHWFQRSVSLRSSIGGDHRGVFLGKRNALFANDPNIQSFGPPAGWTSALASNPYLLAVQQELKRVNPVQSLTPAAPYQGPKVLAWGMANFVWMEMKNPVTKSTGGLSVKI